MTDHAIGRLLARIIKQISAPSAAQSTDRFAVATVAQTTPTLMVYLDGDTDQMVPAYTPYKHIGSTLTVNQVVDVFIHRGVPRVLGGY